MRTLVPLVAATLLVSGCTLPGQGDNTSPGERAGDYLHARPYASILVEVDFVNGAEPDGHAMALMEQRLESATAKPVEVVRTGGVPGRGASHRYTVSELVGLEQSHRGQSSGGERAVIYILYVDGGFERDTSEAKTLGAAFRGSAVAMFKASVRAASKSSNLDLTKPALQDVEGSVLVHEMGHLLGLVNLGTPMVTPHEDTSHPGHSNNQNSVMYWAVETSLIGSILGQAPPNDFDGNDNADLRAARAS